MIDLGLQPNVIARDALVNRAERCRVVFGLETGREQCISQRGDRVIHGVSRRHGNVNGVIPMI